MKRSFIIALHIGYWVLYLLLLSVIIAFMEAGALKAVMQKQEKVFWLLVMMSSFTLLPAVSSFYIFYLFLFDKYLAKKRIVALCIAAFAAILLSDILGMLCLSLFTKGKLLSYNSFSVVLGVTTFMSLLALIHGIIALVMKGFINWYNDIKIKKELQQKNFETELALVKLQLSPHFLFNTINNIDVLIARDAVQASAYLNKLSDIIRFMLYETKTEWIQLEKELTYISKYVDLQKIRTANPDFIQFHVEGNAAAWMIAPMLFAPFIENAFKHSVNKKTDHGIVIKINIDDKALHFYCANNCTENPLANHEPGGLGSELIKKRLQLLYPGKHELQVKKENNIFMVHLTILAHEH